MKTKATTQPLFEEGDNVRLVRSLGKDLPKGATATVNEQLTDGNPANDTYVLTFKHWWGYVSAADVEAIPSKQKDLAAPVTSLATNAQKATRPTAAPPLKQNTGNAQALLMPSIDSGKKSFEMGDEVKLIQRPRDKSSTPKIHKGSVGYVDVMETSLVDTSLVSYYVFFPNHNNACISCAPDEIAHTKQQIDSKEGVPVMPHQLQSEKHSF